MKPVATYRKKHPVLVAAFISAAIWLLAGTLPVGAATLNWDQVTWAPGSLTNSYNADPSTPGNVTIGLSGDTQFQTGFPAISNTITGGIAGTASHPGTNALILGMLFNDKTKSLTVTIDFNYTYGVSNVSFNLFDIEKSGTYQDQISGITGTFGTNSITPTITGSPANTVSGTTVTGNSAAGDTSSNGNVFIDFGTNLLTEVTFTLGNGSSASRHPGDQSIGLYDISFTPKHAPEVGPGLASIAVLAVFMVPRLIRALRSTRPHP
jgi:hypothetical protein